MAQPGSVQVQVPSWISRGRRWGSSFDWLVATYGARTSDRLTTVQMRAICDSQAVPQACRATLKHQVSGLSWYLSKDEEGDEPLKETDAKGKHYYSLLRNWMDDEGNIVGLASGVDLLTDDILTARQGGCTEVIRDTGGVAQYVLHVDAATIRFTHERDQPVYQVSPWGEVTEAWEADRFMQVRWHPNPIIGAALLNRTPIQLAYSAIAILAGTDTYNWKLIAEPIPAGVLNLGPGFTEEKARQWKASWEAGMQGIDPEPLGIVYGTPSLQYMPFRPPPKDMAFETTDHWYASLVAACFEMSILDISILTKVSTKAAAEEQAEATKRQGLRQLMHKVKEGIENYILEEGVFFQWEDIDPTDEKAEADIATKNTSRIVELVKANMLTEEQGLLVLQQLKHVPDDVKYDAAEFEKRKQEAQEQFKAKGEEGGEEEEQKEKGGEEEKEEEKGKKVGKSVEKGDLQQAEEKAKLEKIERNMAKLDKQKADRAELADKVNKDGALAVLKTTVVSHKELAGRGEEISTRVEEMAQKVEKLKEGAQEGERSKAELQTKVDDLEADFQTERENVSHLMQDRAKDKLKKAQDLEKLVEQQAKEKALPPPDDDDPIWEADEAYLDELAARVEAGVKKSNKESTENDK